MPIGPTCRACGAPLPPDLGWCARCLTPVTPHAVRPPIHQPGTYAGAPVPTPRTSRWRAGATTFGPLGRILCTIVVLAFFPWGGIGGVSAGFGMNLYFLLGWVFLATVVLRSVWRRERVPDDAPPGWADRFRERHPVLARRLEAGPWTLVVVAIATISIAAIAWLNLDDVNRYVWGSVAIVTGVAAFLVVPNDL